MIRRILTGVNVSVLFLQNLSYKYLLNYFFFCQTILDLLLFDIYSILENLLNVFLVIVPNQNMNFDEILMVP